MWQALHDRCSMMPANHRRVHRSTQIPLLTAERQPRNLRCLNRFQNIMHSPLIVTPGDPRDPQAARLLQASHDLMQSLFPPEDNHYLSIEALLAPHIRFFVARQDAQTLGTIAMAHMGSYGEVKSMFVDPAARKRGVAQALLDHVTQIAREEGLLLLRLETGNLLHAAHALYRRHGFTLCGPFGDYEANNTSLFMEKPLL